MAMGDTSLTDHWGGSRHTSDAAPAHSRLRNAARGSTPPPALISAGSTQKEEINNMQQPFKASTFHFIIKFMIGAQKYIFLKMSQDVHTYHIFQFSSIQIKKNFKLQRTGKMLLCFVYFVFLSYLFHSFSFSIILLYFDALKIHCKVLWLGPMGPPV